MNNELLAWLILAAPTIIEAGADVYDHRRGKRDKKGQDVIVRGIMFWLAGVILKGMGLSDTVWQGTLLSLGFFIFFFDYTMGYLLTKRLEFLGKTSKSDRFLKHYTAKQVLLARGVFFAISVALYYLI